MLRSRKIITILEIITHPFYILSILYLAHAEMYVPWVNFSLSGVNLLAVSIFFFCANCSFIE